MSSIYCIMYSTMPYRQLEAVMSKYHIMDTNEYPNTFECHIMYQTNIQIYSNATYLPNKYPNIFLLRK